MNAKISVLVICIEVIIYLLLYNMQDCTFKSKINITAYQNTIQFRCLSITQLLDKSNSLQPTVRLSLCRTLFSGTFRAIPIETPI